MLQQSTNPPQMTGATSTASEYEYGTIDARIQPLEREPDHALECEIDHLIAQGDVQALCALYDCYVLASDVMVGIKNQPRASEVEDFLEEERNRLMSKAYLVADRMQHMKPERFEHDDFCRVLFDCAIQMGSGVQDAIAAVGAVPKPPLEAEG